MNAGVHTVTTLVLIDTAQVTCDTTS